MTGNTISLQVDSTMVANYLLKEEGTGYKTLNGLSRKISLKCHRNGVILCPEYLRGMANLQTNALSRHKKSSGVELGSPSQPQVMQMVVCSNSRSVCRQTGTQGTLILDLSDRRASVGDTLKERWSQGLSCAFPPPNIIHLVLSRLVRWGGDLIMIIPFSQKRTGPQRSCI